MGNITATNVPVHVTRNDSTNELVFSAEYEGKLWPLAVQKAGLAGLDDAPSGDNGKTSDGNPPTEV